MWSESRGSKYMIIDPSKNCPCIDCKTRSPVCHGICPLYAKYRKDVATYNTHVKRMQKQMGGRVMWNQTKGYIYKKRGW